MNLGWVTIVRPSRRLGYRAAMSTLLGGAEQANAQMDKLDAFARTSPFSKAVFIQAQQQMIADVVAGTIDAYKPSASNRRWRPTAGWAKNAGDRSIRRAQATRNRRARREHKAEQATKGNQHVE